ncbi:helix-turn-helix domain-containing protein [Nicoliella lavandulae]|uniref:helix-turn-helix domain-containing protein n=1 Tax=Nicoliella lavandulae TaxID=3082954 RepID=UPI0035A081F2
MENFTFNQLRYFYKLVQTLNYRQAAEELYISQPVLSKQIKALEKAIQVKLFYKTGDILN